MMKKRIVIVGGGIGGTMTANNMVSKLGVEIRRNQVEVMLISNSPWHYYKPAFMYVAFDMYHKAELRRKQATLLRPEVRFVVDEVEAFEFSASRLHTRSGAHYDYDYLVVSTGCLPAPERIEGLAEAGDHFYQFEPARRLAQKLRTIERGRIFITVTFPKTPDVPHQCGIAPIETTLMVDELLRRRGVRDRVEILYTYPSVSQLLRNCLFMQKQTCEVLPQIFSDRDIHFKRGFTLERVDPDARVAHSSEGDSEDFDILMSTPPIRAVDAVINSGVSEAAEDEGWLPTNRRSLQLKGHPNVYCMGDTVDLPISKAGGSCHNQSPVIIDNIAFDLRQGATPAVYDGRVQAIAQMGLEAGMPLWYDYDQDVQPTPPTKVGGLMRKTFNRGVYWATARGLV
ncbi:MULTISPECIES: NAD(P)/FAD-dependent oxidoreductase [Marichromatium]|nr:FAD/NAD(P)-binding oxidoreductase [Marichromatium gracile]